MQSYITVSVVNWFKLKVDLKLSYYLLMNTPKKRESSLHYPCKEEHVLFFGGFFSANSSFRELLQLPEFVGSPAEGLFAGELGLAGQQSHTRCSVFGGQHVHTYYASVGPKQRETHGDTTGTSSSPDSGNTVNMQLQRSRRLSQPFLTRAPVVLQKL